MTRGLPLLLTLLLASAGCRAAEPTAPAPIPAPIPAIPRAPAADPALTPPLTKENAMMSDAPTSIGTATMRDDGTIEMNLRAEGPGGLVGDSFFTYAPDDPNYKSVLEHLGGMKPGDTKPVPPWE